MAAATRRTDMVWLMVRPSGRVGRQIFVLGFLFWLSVDFALATELTKVRETNGAVAFWTSALVGVVFLSIFSMAMIAVKRLHDIGSSGLPVLLLFVPAVSLIILIGLCLWPSKSGANAYGATTDRPGH